jgi:hypothetical protein
MTLKVTNRVATTRTFGTSLSTQSNTRYIINRFNVRTIWCRRAPRELSAQEDVRMEERTQKTNRKKKKPERRNEKEKEKKRRFTTQT